MIDSILTVVTAAESQDLVTLEMVRDELPNVPVEDNGFLTRAKRQASAAIAKYCGRVFVAETVTEALHDHWNHGHTVSLRRYPIISIATVTADNQTLTEGSDYVVDKERGILSRTHCGHRFAWCYRTLTVTYTGGYAPADIPPDLQEAALRLVTARYAARGRDPALRQYNVPGVLEQQFWISTSAEALPPDVAALADPYLEIRT